MNCIMSKILQIIPTLGSGGAERFVIDLSNELNKTNDLKICTLYDIGSNKEYSFFRNELNSEIELFNLNKKLGFDLFIFFRLFKLIYKLKPDVVHTHLSVLNYMIIPLIFLSKIKYIHTLHNDAKKLIKNKFDRYTSYFIYKNKLINPVCISEESLKSYNEMYNLNNATLIYNGRAKQSLTDEYHAVKNQFDNIKKLGGNIFLNIGRITEEKNQLALVKAFNNFNKKNKSINHLFIIGDGSLKIKKELIKIANDKIHILGRKHNVFDYLSNCDFFILPSIYEGMPISVIEAFYACKVVIVSPVGGMVNMVNNGVNGYLLKGTSVSDINDSLSELMLKEQHEMDIIKNNAYDSYIKNYSIFECANKYIKLYISII